jgi:hypothetical protein
LQARLLLIFDTEAFSLTKRNIDCNVNEIGELNKHKEDYEL